MDALNNKRYLGQIMVACAVLCLSTAVAAQELQTSEPMTQKGTEMSVTVVATEETKDQAAKTEEPTNEPINASKNEAQTEGIVGFASFYAAKFQGKRTASGEKFSSKLLTAAHLSLPFGTLLKVTNPTNSKSVIVRVNDRGPYIRGRLLDLSRAAADLIGITRLGVARVELEILKP
jgi:rare lipoprotein A